MTKRLRLSRIVDECKPLPRASRHRGVVHRVQVPPLPRRAPRLVAQRDDGAAGVRPEAAREHAGVADDARQGQVAGGAGERGGARVEQRLTRGTCEEEVGDGAEV